VGRIGRILIYAGLTVEAMLGALVVLAMVRLVPFARYAGWLRGHAGRADPPALLVARVKRVMKLVSRVLPRRSACLVAAIVARVMLARRGFASELTLGIKDKADVLSAHAWLMAGPVIVTGNQGTEQYQRVATF
jgi:hypothetical protein